MRKTRIPKRSKKQIRREKGLAKLRDHLILNRAKGRCELPGCLSQFLLQEHHIVFRSRRRDDTAQNIMIGCFECHDHYKYPLSGLPISVEEALNLIKERNLKYNIDPELHF